MRNLTIQHRLHARFRVFHAAVILLLQIPNVWCDSDGVLPNAIQIKRVSIDLPFPLCVSVCPSSSSSLSLCQSMCWFDSFDLFFFRKEWVGDLDSENAGRLGLWQVCQRDETSDNCQKQLSDFLSIPSIPFQVIVFLLNGASSYCFTFTFLFVSYVLI